MFLSFGLRQTQQRNEWVLLFVQTNRIHFARRLFVVTLADVDAYYATPTVKVTP